MRKDGLGEGMKRVRKRGVYGQQMAREWSCSWWVCGVGFEWRLCGSHGGVGSRWLGWITVLFGCSLTEFNPTGQGKE